jgi:rhamnogalacturonyl hydrolase YesR
MALDLARVYSPGVMTTAMRCNLGLFLAAILLAMGQCASAQTTPSTPPPLVYQRDDVLDLMKRVMNFQIKAYDNKTPITWQAGAFWAGVTGAFDATKDPAFHDAAKKLGESVDWKLAVDRRPFHSDSVAIGQAYLDLYLADKQIEMIGPLKEHVEKYLEKKTIAKGDVGNAPGVQEGAPFIGRNVWWWCDALFMAPPVFARMHAATGDPKWLDSLHSLYWDSVEFLYDPAEGLFYRDARYFPDQKKTPSGKKMFWARGNGWVYAGIIRTIDYIPENDPQRPKYIDLFRQMTPAIVKYQGEDGMWRPCINDPEWFSMPESSGSGFFCYGLLAGINRGILDRDTYLPIALRAWAGLTSHVNADGLLGYAQKEGAAPAETDANTFRDYANGAFLLAGSELYKMNLSAKDITRLKKPD